MTLFKIVLYNQRQKSQTDNGHIGDDKRLDYLGKSNAILARATLGDGNILK